jgi:large subunit ribosomal protein L6e
MAPKPVRASRNKELVRGIGRNGRSKTYHKRGLWAIKAKNGGTFPTHPKAAVAEAPAVRAPKFYPADDVKKPLHKNKVVNPPKLRSSITPGTVLILLAGHFKGKRVVFLKQLGSGLLLVTGPFKVNGVPLRRVNQAYVIATSTKIDISSVDVAKYADSYFKKEVTKKKKGESEFFEAEKDKEETSLPAEKKEDQKAIDTKLIPLIEAVPELKTYLSSRFSLKSGVKPHELVF